MVYEPSDQAQTLFGATIHDDGPQVLAPLHPGDRCPIGWQPNSLAPVFYGVRDLGPADGVPAPTRLFFPSLDGAVWAAPILEGCGRYPVVVLNHGQCNDDTGQHYKQWFELPRRLAKSGYVVLVPRLSFGSITEENPPAFAAMTALLQWARESWVHRAVVLPSPASAVIGHSWGGLLAGRFAARSPDVAAFVSLSSGWEHEFPMLASDLEHITAPKLFVTGDLDPPSVISQGLWADLSVPKHRATFAPFSHWDYLPDGTSSCRGQSACSQLPGAAFDLILMFLSRYLPPEHAHDLPHRVPDSLIPPTPLSLTFEQQFYTGSNWLTAIERMEEEAECRVSLDWETPETRFVPHVRFLPAGAAIQAVRARDLRPKFTGENGTSSWVFTQSPAPGTRVKVGDTVTMRLRTGPIP